MVPPGATISMSAGSPTWILRIGLIVSVTLLFYYNTLFTELQHRFYAEEKERVNDINATVVSHNNATTTTAGATTKNAIIFNGTFFFVHIGKSAGSSVRGTLRPLCNYLGNEKNRKRCLASFINREETMLSKRTVSTKHCHIMKPEVDVAAVDNFLVSLRDPMDRFMSAFYMGTPRNGRGCDIHTKVIIGEEVDAFYCQCFEYMGDFVNSLAGGSSTNHSTNTTTTTPASHLIYLPEAKINTTCHDIGRKLLRPNPPPWTSHMATFNYRFYFNFISKYPKKPIAVIRQEHMWEDLQQMEYLLGGNASVGPELYESTTHGSESYRYKRGLSKEETQLLCCLILDEVKIYVDLLKRAINLDDGQRNESLRALEQRCDRDLCLQPTR